MSSLKLTYTPDPSDDVGLLLVEAHSKEFSGRGTSWASPSQLEEFCRRLETYPISEQDPVTFYSGLNDLKGRDLLCKIVLRPADLRGNLFLEAEVADRDDSWGRVQLRFHTNYTDVARFQQAMTAMLSGIKATATLQGCG